jgi:hypothetical protein
MRERPCATNSVRNQCRATGGRDARKIAPCRTGVRSSACLAARSARRSARSLMGACAAPSGADEGAADDRRRAREGRSARRWPRRAAFGTAPASRARARRACARVRPRVAARSAWRATPAPLGTGSARVHARARAALRAFHGSIRGRHASHLPRGCSRQQAAINRARCAVAPRRARRARARAGRPRPQVKGRHNMSPTRQLHAWSASTTHAHSPCQARRAGHGSQLRRGAAASCRRCGCPPCGSASRRALRRRCRRAD